MRVNTESSCKTQKLFGHDDNHVKIAAKQNQYAHESPAEAGKTSRFSGIAARISLGRLRISFSDSAPAHSHRNHYLPLYLHRTPHPAPVTASNTTAITSCGNWRPESTWDRSFAPNRFKVFYILHNRVRNHRTCPYCVSFI